MSKNKRKNKKFIFGLVMGLVLLFGLVPLQQIVAETGAEKAARIGMNNYENTLGNLATQAASSYAGGKVEDGIKWFLEQVFSFCVSVLSWAMKLLDYVISPEVFDKSLFNSDGMRGINEGWEALRDFLNMFFILMLLLVALGTILRVPKFSDKKIIFSIIAAALLINFSKAIALVIIDISQLAMTFFSSLITSNITDFSTAFFQKIELEKTFQGDVTDNFFVEILFAILFVLIMAFMIGVIAAALLIRLVAFYVLIILSPLAMFGIALPGTALSGMSKGWFTKMTKWAFFGPIMLFFLWLAFVVINAIATTDSLSSEWQDFSNAGEKSLLGILVPYIAAIYLLFYGYDMAMKTSTGLANKVLGWGDRKMKEWGGKIAKGSVAVGTLGMAPYVASRSRGFRDKDRRAYNPLGWAKTKERKEAIKKEKDERRRAKGSGASEYNRHNRNKAKELLKKWEDSGGLDDKEGKRIDKRGSSVEKKAKALYDAKENNFKDVGAFEKAMSSVGKGEKRDKVLEAEIRKETEKKNAEMVVEYDVKKADEALKTGNEETILEATKSNMILKRAVNIENERLGSTGADELNNTEKIDYLLGRGDYAVGGSRAIETRHGGGFVAPGGTYTAAHRARLREHAFNDQFDNMSNNSLLSQNPRNLGSGSQAVRYIMANTGSDQRFSDQSDLRERAARYGNANTINALRNGGAL